MYRKQVCWYYLVVIVPKLIWNLKLMFLIFFVISNFKRMKKYAKFLKSIRYRYKVIRVLSHPVYKVIFCKVPAYWIGILVYGLSDIRTLKYHNRFEVNFVCHSLVISLPHYSNLRNFLWYTILYERKVNSPTNAGIFFTKSFIW